MSEKNYCSVEEKISPNLEKDDLELVCIKSRDVNSALKTEATKMPCACSGYEGYCCGYS